MAAAVRVPRSPLAITFGVWKALFLREATARLARTRFAWAGLVLEPAAHIGLLMWLFYIGFKQRQIAGGDTALFIMLGVLGIFLPRNILTRAAMAVARSERLYAFRNVRPVDAVIARAMLESLLCCVVFAVVLTAAAFAGFPVAPADPLGALAAYGALWLIGIGLALVLSVAASAAGFAAVPRIITLPMYLFSAVVYPSLAVPPSMREVLLYNPLLHGIESLRVAFMPSYLVPAGIDLFYLVQWAVPLVCLGLALHVRYQEALIAR